MLMVQISALRRRAQQWVEKTIRLPSGDQSGFVARRFALVSCRTLDPSAFIRYTAL